MDDTLCKKEIKSFLNDEEQLTGYPVKYKRQIFALFHLASKFEPGVKYTEKEVNQILNRWHTFEDWAMLRRDLYDRRFMNREPNGSCYWLEENQPTLATLGLE